MSAARRIQCEEAVTEYGFLAKHPTTGSAIQVYIMKENFHIKGMLLRIL